MRKFIDIVSLAEDFVIEDFVIEDFVIEDFVIEDFVMEDDEDDPSFLRIASKFALVAAAVWQVSGGGADKSADTVADNKLNQIEIVKNWKMQAQRKKLIATMSREGYNIITYRTNDAPADATFTINGKRYSLQNKHCHGKQADGDQAINVTYKDGFTILGWKGDVDCHSVTHGNNTETTINLLDS
jgi:hypothetical protein